MTEKVRWGILGCGWIAHSFVKALQTLPDAVVTAVASRTPGKADHFADQYGVAVRYTAYEELVADTNVDVVYVATTHNFHHDNVTLCLNGGKHVLCEKPFTVNAIQARELAALARKKNLFLMEAVWTRFIPAIRLLTEQLAAGTLGEIYSVEADFRIHVPYDPNHRLYKRELAGGALLDLGIYPLTFADIVFREKPVSVTSQAIIGKTGVDESSYYFLEYAGERLARLSASCRTFTPHRALIAGSRGYIEVPHFFFPEEFHVHLHDGKEETVRRPFRVNGYEYEAEETMRCIKEGLTQSPLLPVAKTIELLELMDGLRKAWGLRYPGE